MSTRRCDIREQLRDRWGSYASAFSVGSRFVMELHSRENRKVSGCDAARKSADRLLVAVYCTFGRLTLGGICCTFYAL